MHEPDASQLTQLLVDWQNGNKAALDQLMPVVYDHLQRIARQHMRREAPGHTLQTSALINEAYMRLINQTSSWRNRAHFFAIAAQLMRNILVDHARAHLRAKRGGGALQVSLSAAKDLAGRASEMVALDDALRELAELDPQKARIIELRFFAGLTIEETAEALGISDSTVEREWRVARARLRQMMKT